jgi:signal transduction histidine kinase
VTQDEVKEKLRRMNRQVDRLALLIEDMLDVSRAQSGKLSLRLEHVDMRDIVNEVVERTFPSPADDPRGHPIHLSLPDAPVVGHWDRTRIDQVLTNLLTNAAKYSPPGEPIAVVLRQRDGLALLDVKDRGIGIPTDEQEHLFQPFFRARNASSNDYSGIGLGLYLSRELVLRHGGDITVTSAEGRGSVVHVELPCSTGPSA